MEYDYVSQLISLQLTQSEVNSGAAAKKVNSQITKVMEHFTSQGYEFYSQITLPTIVAPGCLASLLGSKSTTVDLPVLVFRKLK